MNNYLLTPDEIKEVLENLVIEQPQWDYDSGQFVNGEEYQKATAIQQAVLSKLLAAAPDVWEKVALYFRAYYFRDDTDIARADRAAAKVVEEIITPAILAAADEANAKWVTALKPFGITVDSPESLAGAVQVLLDEARQEGQDDVLTILENDYPDETESIRQSLGGKE